MYYSRHYQSSHDRQLALWLITCAVVIYGMILLGGVTRLTESGLSMVEWRPLMGIVPPLGEAAWQDVFEYVTPVPVYQSMLGELLFLLVVVFEMRLEISGLLLYRSVGE